MAKKIVIAGGGRIGSALARLLAASGDYEPRIVEVSHQRVNQLKEWGLPVVEGDCLNQTVMAHLLAEADGLVAAVTSDLVPRLAEMGLLYGCHFLDFSEKIEIRQQIGSLLKGRHQDCSLSIASGCGLAPGYVGALAEDVISRCDRDDEITVFVGVLPQRRTNRLGYCNIWGVSGLVDEYFNECLALQDGKVTAIAPLSQFESVTVGRQSYEAFTTSGSLDHLVSRYQGKVKNLVFKTLRYPKHLDYMLFLLDDLQFRKRPSSLSNLMLNALSATSSDRVLIAIETTRNSKKGRPVLRVFEGDEVEAASTRLTVAHACCVLDLIFAGDLSPGEVTVAGDLPLDLLSESSFFEMFQAEKEVKKSLAT
ncbi:saccharopine dehydrogenase C-terminal domain-containing protein [uncultured Cohaesibacter sp.]|uniref:saccharopine dehydrogenase C-terminal domain-containing protein n=1 Tax=uncultured Cohaesibacter sp. TaxID=1002546 RepID=UPI0029C8CF6C|nr:saccharopine dehydrogenase C-terminal domain-containing protein [uncultured Cohaesibacter sp.]